MGSKIDRIAIPVSFLIGGVLFEMLRTGAPSGHITWNSASGALVCLMFGFAIVVPTLRLIAIGKNAEAESHADLAPSPALATETRGAEMHDTAVHATPVLAGELPSLDGAFNAYGVAVSAKAASVTTRPH